ncbi:Ketosteroid isomerase-related protein [Asanoa hainanensis]|uniref:Ketosteroid isomerase-related protein n=1 Tax=Asanoa hainanensis TaxID=560556 RepID=A0A239P1Q3_9ACTN|nr:nuclear transport factor 2 family protein [Asanoa hainanensis]SNT60564.1 Ketosteroid isomerase-related protein [Asanoa hainanensis]
MTTESSKTLALDFLQHHLASDQWILDNVHDDFEMSYEHDPGTFPRAGMPPLSKANLRSFGETARAIWGTGEGAVRQTPYGLVIAEGDHVAVQVFVTGTTPGGKQLNNRTAFFFEIKDGQVHRVRLHEDTAYIMKNWGDEVEDLDDNRVE